MGSPALLAACARPTTECAWGRSELRRCRLLCLVLANYGRRLACTLQETETVRCRCGPDSESATCACAVAVRHGAAGQAPLAVSQTRVPCSLDGLRCWCQAAYGPDCDYPLSEDEDEAEVISLQPTAELVDGAH